MNENSRDIATKVKSETKRGETEMREMSVEAESVRVNEE